MSRAVHQHRRQRVEVGISIIAQYPGRGHSQRRVLVQAIAVVIGHRRPIDIGDVKSDGCYSRICQTVIGQIHETVLAEIIGDRRVSEAAIGRKAQRAMRRSAHQNRVQRSAIRIGIIAQHSRRA